MSTILVNFSIFIHGTREYMLLDIPQTSTILDVKVIFAQKYNVSTNSLHIIIEGNLKKDEELLPSIRELSNIASVHVVHKVSSEIVTFTLILNDEQTHMTLNIPESSTISDVKAIISRKIEVPANKLQIIIDDAMTNDDSLLSSYNSRYDDGSIICIMN